MKDLFFNTFMVVTAIILLGLNCLGVYGIWITLEPITFWQRIATIILCAGGAFLGLIVGLIIWIIINIIFEKLIGVD